MTRVPLNVLDLSPISEGSTVQQALRNTLDLARQTEEWGYARYWVAEHHFVAAASSSPTVLIGLIAAATNRIRVGSAAVQIGHHTAASVVEAFGTVAALYPGRIDLGIGRSSQRRTEASADEGAPDAAGVLRSERRAEVAHVLQHPHAEIPDFDEQVGDVIAFLNDDFTTSSGLALTATPGAGADVELWLFGSSGGQSAQVAGARGLPFVANYHVSPGTTLDAVEAYRAAFVPSSTSREPYVVVSADVVVAESDSHAAYLASSFPQWVYSIRSGHGAIPYPDPKTAEPLTDEQQVLVEDRVATQFVGSAATVAAKLDGLQKATGADELVVTTITHDHADRLRSYELLGKEWGLPRLRV
ncbi:MsnO8 family LLM class oxidoreductase [Rhodococcus sp. BP-252]|uniref:MsnO8 family LLM class oxidoreductase n=1 Tax=unclassified Rhodococcus (in: high G+C Gram-positive bacteria) TaxID=192944 RepID=UPI001C9ADCF9|nr:MULTISPECIES: MsnO8 family LLM class oxidoreductase [unclassified Rhodococcus (in: high G+C Gram-positive bacteria)]MBY6412523.1 MsnO8 family LLM class oxidoreductase [Rhodococcus sp. BP-320]MBY6417222.1 MsnO8 family LLM class oxidoreductase [Rhodococcus sp. BP-321]MBY6424147.1 MsnO8 family LLM class oxidoreductase [Rhodococcus sp. BP-324]MBY6427246.1 MsnO8 family LLM class oxidoreductase [Rhodococcus sp. BP-323]MBY6432141.1 MsnO8 family LLM class oxidoreductase [Rhodococcus sp. BP-322]